MLCDIVEEEVAVTRQEVVALFVDALNLIVGFGSLNLVSGGDIVAMYDVVTNLPDKLKVFPYYRDDCRGPQDAQLGLALECLGEEKIVLKSGPFYAHAPIEELTPANGALLTDEFRIGRWINSRLKDAARKPF